MTLLFSATLALFLTPICACAVPVTLRVADTQGRPIAGATARVIDYANWIDDENKLPAPTENLLSADGTFALDLRGTEGDPKLLSASEGGLTGLGGTRVKAPGYGAVNVILFAGENKITLGPSSRIEGAVRDAAGAPIAGAKVRLNSVEDISGSFANYNSSSGLAPETAVADAQGRWQMDGLARGFGSFIVSAPNFVATESIVDLSGPNVLAPPIVLPLAATIKGRIVDAQNQGVAGINVYWDGGYGSHGDAVYSDANGDFVLNDVPLGENRLSFSRLDAGWLGVDEEPEVTLERQGQIADIGTIQESVGLLLSGRVLDKDSGQPLAGVELRAHYSVLKSGADGRFEGRVSKPFYSLDITNGYRFIQRVNPNDAFADKIDAGDLMVERVVKVPLELRDEDGNPAPQARLSFQLVDNPRISLQNNTVFGAESPTIGPLPTGNYAIAGADLWEVVAPKTVSIDANAPAPTVAITVRALKPTVVSGRIVDESGRGRAGVQITVQVGTELKRLITNREGFWSAEFRPSTSEPILGEGEWQNPKRLSGVVLTRGDDGNWQAANIVMSRFDATLNGRVVDAKGAAVAGARVSWNNAPTFKSVATDVEGNFKIESLPATSIALAASDGPSYGQIAATPGVPVEIKLAPASKLSDEELNKLWENASQGEVPRLWPYFEILGAQRIFEATKRFDAKRDPTEIGGLYNYLDILAQRAITPAEREDAASQGVALLRRFPIAQTSGLGAARIAILASRSDDAELRAWAGDWYDAQKQNQSLDRTHPYTIGETLRVATVGALLGRADASDALSIGLTLAERLPGADRSYYFSGWGAIVADGDAQWFEEATSGWSPAQQMSALAGALESVSDATRARALLAQLEKLANDPAILAAEAQQLKQRPDYTSDRQNLLERGRFNFVTRVARLDNAAALAVLEAHPNDFRAGKMAFEIARAALERGQNEIAGRVLKMGLTDNDGDGRNASAMAMLAQKFDPPLARELLERARTIVLPDDAVAGPRDVAFYAFALRDVDAAQGRLLLENQWALQNAEPRPASDNWGRTSDLQNLAWAMSIYDLPRALQWLGEIKDTRNDAIERADKTRIAILAAALATPEQRPLALAIRAFGDF